MKFYELPLELQAQVRSLEVAVKEYGKKSPEVKPLYLELKKSEVVCGAITGSLKVCIRSPHFREDGSSCLRCGNHGGKSLGGDNMTDKQKDTHKKNLKPRDIIHGLYSSSWLDTLSEEEIAFMEWLEAEMHKEFLIESALELVILEGLIQKAVMHFRLLNSGRIEQGSKHLADPMADIMKTAKELGWLKKSNDEKRSDKTAKALASLIDLASSMETLDDEEKPLN